VQVFRSTYSASGAGWTYDPATGLALTDFNGGPIYADGDLDICAVTASTVTGRAGVFSGRAITVNGAMTLSDGGGKLTVNASVYRNEADTTLYGSAIAAESVSLLGDYEVQGNCTYNENYNWYYWTPSAYAIGAAATVTLGDSGVVRGGTYTVEQNVNYYGYNANAYAVSADTVVMTGHSRVIGGAEVYSNGVAVRGVRAGIDARNITLCDWANVTGEIGCGWHHGNGGAISITDDAVVDGRVMGDYYGTVSVSGSASITDGVFGGNVTIAGTPTITSKVNEWGYGGTLIGGQSVRINSNNLTLSAVGNNAIAVSASAVYITGSGVTISGSGDYGYGVNAWQYLEITGNDVTITGGSGTDGNGGYGVSVNQADIRGNNVTITGGSGVTGGTGIEINNGNNTYTPLMIRGNGTKIIGGAGTSGNGGDGIRLNNWSSNQYNYRVEITGQGTAITGGDSDSGNGGSGITRSISQNTNTYAEIKGDNTEITGGESRYGSGGYGIALSTVNIYGKTTVQSGGGAGVYGILLDTDYYGVYFGLGSDGTCESWPRC